MVEDRNGLEVLDREESLTLLATATVGRIGITRPDGVPMVLPVNFCLDDDRILVLTTEGSKFDAATEERTVAFEVDDFDPIYHSGWSVLVTGVARAVTGADERHVVHASPLARWARRGACHVVEIALEEVSGRRLQGA